MFSEHGCSDTLLSDNGPCYGAIGLSPGMHDMGVHCITSSPHYHQWNGLTEKYVQLVKSLLYKDKESVEAPCFALMLYRSTPLGHDLLSLIELLCDKQARSDLSMEQAPRM